MDLERTVHNRGSYEVLLVLTTVYASNAPAVADPQVDGVRGQTYT